MAKENNLLLESSTDSANGRITAAPRQLNRGAVPILLYPLFGYSIRTLHVEDLFEVLYLTGTDAVAGATPVAFAKPEK